MTAEHYLTTFCDASCLHCQFRRTEIYAGFYLILTMTSQIYNNWGIWSASKEIVEDFPLIACVMAIQKEKKKEGHKLDHKDIQR